MYKPKATQMSLAQLKESIPLYSDLTDLLIEFLEPCLDYSVPQCTHEVAFCQCGNTFQFHENWTPTSKKFLLEKFCPFCAMPNPHKTGMPCSQDNIPNRPIFRRTTHLQCRRCNNTIESYAHKFCSACQNPIDSKSFGFNQK